MGKHNKTKHRAKGNRPAPTVPYPVQNRQLREQIDEVERQAARMRRCLWLAVQHAGGRLEVDEHLYHEAMNMPAEDSCVGIEHDGERMKVVFIFTDEKGEPLPQPKKSDIIITDDP